MLEPGSKVRLLGPYDKTSSVLRALLPMEPKSSPMNLMLPVILFHLGDIFRSFGAIRVVLMLTLHLDAVHIRHILILIARLISLSPVDKLIPILALPGLKGV